MPRKGELGYTAQQLRNMRNNPRRVFTYESVFGNSEVPNISDWLRSRLTHHATSNPRTWQYIPKGRVTRSGTGHYNHTVDFYVNHRKFNELKTLIAGGNATINSRQFDASINRIFRDTGGMRTFGKWVSENLRIQGLRDTYNFRDSTNLRSQYASLSAFIAREGRKIDPEFRGYDEITPGSWDTIQKLTREFPLEIGRYLGLKQINKGNTPDYITVEQTIEMIPGLRERITKEFWKSVQELNTRGPLGNRGRSSLRLVLNWNLDLAKGIDNLIYYGLRENTYYRARSIAEDIQDWMYYNAPWRDRTWNARNGLRAEVYERNRGNNQGLDISLHYSGIDYDQFLEFSYGGTYAIILPALEHWQDRIMDFLSVGILSGNMLRNGGLE